MTNTNIPIEPNWLDYATEFTFRVSDDRGLDVHPPTVSYRGHGLYAIIDGGWTPHAVWSEQAQAWEHEPLPSEREDEFLARTRYSQDDALRIAYRIHQTMPVAERPAGNARGVTTELLDKLDEARRTGIPYHKPCPWCPK